ncbi:MAG: hypothetical protein ACO3JL_16550, partial [Myxococcota bacterium]
DLPQDRVTRLSLRAVDEAGNVSDEYLAAIEEDSRRPARPTNVVPVAGNESVEVTWDLPLDLSGNRDDEDIAGYLVYYGTDGSTALPIGGADAAQGPSPVFTTNRGALRLTGLPNAVTLYVNVTSVDEVWLSSVDDDVKAAHESSPDSSSPRRVQPGEISPRLVHCSEGDEFGSTSPQSVVLSEGVAYVGLGNGSGEVRAYDVSVPETPQLLGSVTLSRQGNVHTLVKQGRFLYALVGNTGALSASNGWAIIDSSSLSVVYESGATRLATAAINGLWVNGPSVILSVANPQSFFSPYRGWTEHYALGASLLDDSATPMFLGSTRSLVSSDLTYAANDKLRRGGPVTMRADGAIFSLMGNALQPIQLFNGEASSPRGCDAEASDTITCPSAFVLPTTDTGRSIHTRGTDIVGVFYGGVRSFSAANPFILSQVGAISLASSGGRSAYGNGLLFVPTFGGGLDIVNVENTALLRSLGTALFTCDGADFSDSGNYLDISIEHSLMAMTANDSQGELRMAHVADPVRFAKLGSALVETTGQTTVRMAAGPDVIVVGGSNLLTAVYDTSTPGNIQRRQMFTGTNGWSMRDGAFLGPYLIAVGGNNAKWLRVLSFQDPANVVDVAQLGSGCAGSCSPSAIAVADEFAYISFTEGNGPSYTVRGLRVGDAIDRRTATALDTADLIGRIDFDSAAHLPERLLAHRGRLYGLAEDGLKVMSLAPGVPTQYDGNTPQNGFRLLADEQSHPALGVGAGNSPHALAASGRYLFARWGSSVFTWDLSDPDDPQALRVVRGEPNLTQSGDEALYDFESGDLVFSGGYLLSGRSVFRVERIAEDVVRYTRIARRDSGAAARLHVHGAYLFAASDNAVEAYKME